MKILQKALAGLLMFQFLFSPLAAYAANSNKTKANNDVENSAMAQELMSQPASAFPQITLAKNDPLLDANPFFLKGQQWVDASVSDEAQASVFVEGLAYRKTKNGVQLHIAGFKKDLSIPAPLHPVGLTNEFVILAADSASKIFDRVASDESFSGQGFFIAKISDLNLGQKGSEAVPLFYFPLPDGDDWRGNLKAVDVAAQNLVVVSSESGESSLPITTADIETIYEAGQINLALAQVWALQEGGEEKLARIQGEFSNPRDFIKALSAHVELVPGSTAGFGSLFVGYDLNHPERSFGHSLKTSKNTRTFLEKNLHWLNPLYVPEAQASGFAAIQERAVWVLSMSSFIYVSGIAIRYSILKHVFDLRNAETSLNPVLPKPNSKISKWWSGFRNTRIGMEFVNSWDIFAHSMTTIGHIPAAIGGLTSQYWIDRLIPSIGAGPNSFIRRLLQCTFLWSRDTNQKTAVNGMTFYKGAGIQGIMDTTAATLQLTLVIPQGMHLIAPHVSDSLQTLITQAFDPGNAATSNYVWSDIVRNTLAWLMGGASQYSHDTREQIFDRLREQVKKEMRLKNLNPEDPKNARDLEKAIDVIMNTELVQRGLPDNKEFLYDVNALVDFTDRLDGHLAPGAEYADIMNDLLEWYRDNSKTQKFDNLSALNIAVGFEVKNRLISNNFDLRKPEVQQAEAFLVSKLRNWFLAKYPIQSNWFLPQSPIQHQMTPPSTTPASGHLLWMQDVPPAGKETFPSHYLMQERPGIRLPALKKARDYVATLLKADPANTTYPKILELFDRHVRDSNLASLQALNVTRWPGLIKKMRKANQSLVLLSFVGSYASEIPSFMLPQTWVEQSDSDIANLAALYYRRAFFSYLNGDPTKLSPPVMALQSNEVEAIQSQVGEDAVQAHAEVLAHGKLNAASQKLYKDLATQDLAAKAVDVAKLEEQAAEYSGPELGWFARWQKARIEAAAVESFMADPKIESLSPAERNKLFQLHYTRIYAKRMGIYLSERNSGALLTTVMNEAETKTQNEVTQTVGLGAYLKKLNRPEAMHLVSYLYAVNFAQSYERITTQEGKVDALSIDQPGAFQWLRRAPAVRGQGIGAKILYSITSSIESKRYLTRLVRFMDSSFNDQSASLGFWETAGRRVPFGYVLGAAIVRNLKGMPAGLLIRYPFYYYMWHMHMSYGSWILFYTMAWTIIGPQFWTNQVMRNQGIKPMSDMDIIKYEFLRSWVTFLGNIPILLFAGDFNAMFDKATGAISNAVSEKVGNASLSIEAGASQLCDALLSGRKK